MATDGASIASLWADIDPRAANFWTKFKAQTEPGAAKAGKDLGEMIGRGLIDKIADGINEGVTLGGKSALTNAGKAGNDGGGKYGAQFRRRVELELSRIGDAQVGIDSGAVNAEIARIRSEITGLNGTVDISVTSTTTVAELRRLRREAERLGTASPTISVSTAGVPGVTAELLALQAIVDTLGASSPTIRVRASTGTVAARLAAITAEATALGAVNPTININVNGAPNVLSLLGGISGSAGRARVGMQYLISTALLLGPAIIPMAAASATAIAGIGLGALAGAGAIGALALGTRGVGAALKAMSAAQDGAAKSATQLASRQSAVTTASDGLRSAQASLANTVANAADSQARSSRQIQDALRSEADANRELFDAQRAVAQARETAERAEEDRLSRIYHLELDQEQAAIDIAKAEEELADARKKAAAAPGNKALARTAEEARIALEQQKLRVVDLEVEHTRLASEQEEAQRVGTDGSDQVVAALERVREATENVRKAEQATADARQAQAEQARQNAFSIAQAQQGVVSAQQAVQDAVVSTGDVGSSAMDELHKAMANLTPEGQRFAKFLFSLRDEWRLLTGAAASGVLPGLQAGITSLLPVLPGFAKGLHEIAVTTGELAAKAGAAFASPYWRDFGRFLVDTTIPAMHLGAEMAGNFAVALSALLKAFLPLGNEMGYGLLDFSRRFAQSALTIENTSGYRSFLTYVREQGPVVARTLGDLAQAIGHIILALQPIGTVSLTIIRGFSAAISAIPVDVLTGILAGIIAINIAVRVTGVLAPIFVVLQGTILGAAGAMRTASFSSGALGTSLAGLRGAALGARAGAGSLLATLGGPWGIAFAAAAITAGMLIHKSQQQKAMNEDLKDSLVDLARAYHSTDGSASQAVESLIQQNDALRQLILNSEKFGLSIDDVVKATEGDAAARNKVLASYDAEIERQTTLLGAHKEAAGWISSDKEKQRQIREEAGLAEGEDFIQRIHRLEAERKAVAESTGAAEEAARAAERVKAANIDWTRSMESLRTALGGGTVGADGYRGALDALGGMAGTAAEKADALAIVSQRVADAQFDGAQKAGLFKSILDQLGSTTETQGLTFDALATTFGNIAASSLTARDKVDLLRDAMDRMYGAARSQIDVDLALKFGQQELREQLDSNRAGFELNAFAAEGNTAAVRSNIEKLRELLKTMQEKFLQDIANGQSVEAATHTYNTNKDAILNSIPPAQQNTQAVKDLTAAYGQIPPVKTTQVSTPGIDKAVEELVIAHSVQIGLAQKPPWTKDQIGAEVDYLTKILSGKAGSIAMFKADGGPIDGWSPHPKADNVPIWATAGEYMHQVSAVDYYGRDAMDAINNRRIPRQVIRGYATGGLVGPFTRYGNGRNFTVDIPTSVSMPQTLDQYWADWEKARKTWTANQSLGGDFGPGPGFPPWPSGPPESGGPSGDSGVWQSIVALIRSTGPLSGSFGNGYRPGDPKWHGAGHAVDWMGFNQDALATFLAGRRPLELIHRTNTRDYAYTRGRNFGSFDNQLMEEHRNHVHIAMDQGGYLMPGWTPPIWNGTGKPEPVLTSGEWDVARANMLRDGGSGRPESGRALVAIENYHERGSDPHSVAADLDWLARGLG